MRWSTRWRGVRRTPFWAFGHRVGFYAHYDGEMSRNRLVAILLMPLLIISIVPLLVSAVTQVSSGWVAFVSAFNAFCACADMLQAGLVLFQIPATRDCPLQELEDILERA